MSITSLVNDIYNDQIKAEKIDTVLFLNECQNDFFVERSPKKLKIFVLFFISRDSLRSYVRKHKQSLIFKSNITDIGNKEMKLRVGLYRSSNSNGLESSDFLLFVDERIISCFYSDNTWRLNKTISIEDH
jgi:hypothetical protein